MYPIWFEFGSPQKAMYAEQCVSTRFHVFPRVGVYVSFMFARVQTSVHFVFFHVLVHGCFN